LVILFLSKKKFIATDDNITVADLALKCHIENLARVGYKFNERVAKYLKDVY